MYQLQMMHPPSSASQEPCLADVSVADNASSQQPLTGSLDQLYSLLPYWLKRHAVLCVQVYEGRVVEGDPSVCGHVISTTATSGTSRSTINYSTERVVGNGSFGVVFQATCLETGETVRHSSACFVCLLAVVLSDGEKFVLGCSSIK